MDKKTVSLLRGYLEKAKEKLKVSKSLLQISAYEDAVSRAYYAAFHAAQAVLLTEGLTTSTHQGLVNLFGLHMVKTEKFEKKFGRYLSNLKDDREAGDYEIYSAIDEEVARNAVREAQEFFAAAEAYVLKLINV